MCYFSSLLAASRLTDLILQFSAVGTRLKASPSGNFSDPNALANVTIMGLQQPVTTVQLNGVGIGQVWTFDESLHVLHVTGLNNLTAKGAWSQEWTLSWT